jgi:hypothetical protein
MKTWTALTLLGVIFAVALGCSDSRAEDAGDIRELILYAEQFDPCTPDDIRGKWGSCKNLFNTPDKIETILKKHEMTHDYKASVMLVLLKHYNYEFSNFHQGYEVRRGLFKKDSAFVKAFIRIDGRGGGDYMTAGVAWSWVNGHPEFLKNKLIAEEMKKVDDAAKEIEEMNKNLEKEFERKNSHTKKK